MLVDSDRVVSNATLEYHSAHKNHARNPESEYMRGERHESRGEWSGDDASNNKGDVQTFENARV
jgi:hypothetical protein